MGNLRSQSAVDFFEEVYGIPAQILVMQFQDDSFCRSYWRKHQEAETLNLQLEFDSQQFWYSYSNSLNDNMWISVIKPFDDDS